MARRAGCGKPDFFIQKKPLFEVHLDTGMLYNTDGGTPMVRPRPRAPRRTARPFLRAPVPAPGVPRAPWMHAPVSPLHRGASCAPSPGPAGRNRSGKARARAPRRARRPRANTGVGLG